MFKLLHDAEDGTVVPLIVTGTSMMPFLFHKRSTVFLEKNSNYVPRRGDIVFFMRTDTTPILHRIHKIKKNGTLVIKGDAQRWSEEIQPIQIFAHVTHIIRRDRKFSVDYMPYRMMVALWRPFRLLHPFLAYCVYAWHRIPSKLSRIFRKGSS
jgi:signal peptidase I